MPDLANIFDTYERRARVYPMLLVLLPVALGLASWLPAGLDLVGLVGGMFAVVALAAFFGQVARDQGKKREPDLFDRWGGKPSVLALSFSGGYLDRATVERVHRKVRELDANLSLPATPEEEASDPECARTAYGSANELLLSQTRDRARFPLVFAENVNYGYRRNLWAMKPAGVVIAGMGVAGSGARLIFDAASDTTVTWTAAGGVIVGATLTVFWMLRVNPSWVRTAADAFAKQLVGAAQSL